MKVSKRLRKGLTLIELIAVISILLILASIIIPTAGSVIQSARKAKAANQLRQIALVISQIAQETPSALNGGSTHDIYTFIGRISYLSGINQVDLFQIEEDPLMDEGVHVPCVLVDANDPKVLHPNLRQAVISFTFPSKIVPQQVMNAAHIPIAWTRGLRPDGTWDPQLSPYGGRGGHIAFLDGHVQWFKRLDPENPKEQLMIYNSLKPTVNILEAIPPTATVLESR